MYSGAHVIDLVKDQLNEFRDLFLSLLDLPEVDFGDVADTRPDIHPSILPNFNLQKEEIKISFVISQDLKSVTYDKETKNNLRKWIIDKSQDIKVEIDDKYIASLIQWKENKDEKLREGGKLSDDDEKGYVWISNAIQNFSRTMELEKRAINLFLIEGSLDSYVPMANVNAYLAVIERIIMLSRNMVDHHDYRLVDGWLPNRDKEFYFKAYVRVENISEMNRDMITFRDGQIYDFDQEDIINGIIPGLFFYLACNSDRNKELIDKNSIFFSLREYRFGWT